MTTSPACALLREVNQNLPKSERIASETLNGPDGSMSNTSSNPFSDAFSEIRLLTFSSTLSRSNSTLSTDNLPASIFEKSRISLMMPRKVLA